MRARYEAEPPLFISIVRHPCRPIILAIEFWWMLHTQNLGVRQTCSRDCTWDSYVCNNHAQRLRNFKIALQDWNCQAQLIISSEPPAKPLSLRGILKAEIENVKRDWIFSIFGPLGISEWFSKNYVGPKGGHPQQEGINFGMFVPLWLVITLVGGWGCKFGYVKSAASFRSTQTGLCKFRCVWSSLTIAHTLIP